MRSLIVMLLACALATTAANAQSPAPSRTAGAPAWAAFEQTWAGITAYSATVTVFEREGTQVQSSVLDYTFRKRFRCALQEDVYAARSGSHDNPRIVDR
jgi:outer membrane lipoprotein-sorting protein